MGNAYEAYWSAGAFDLGEGVRSVTRYPEGTASMGEDNGYDAEETAAIEALEMGETWSSGDYGLWHRIRRIAGPATVQDPLRYDPRVGEDEDLYGDDALFEEVRGHGPDMEVRVVDPAYFAASGHYTPEAQAVAANLANGESWKADAVTLRRIR